MSVFRAIFLSFLVHAALAALAALLLSVTPTPTVSVELDLSSVDLSFAEQEAEAPPSAASPASPNIHPPALRAETPLPPPTPQASQVPRPPAASTPHFPEPQVEQAVMETPAAPVAPAASAAIEAPAPRQAHVEAPPKPRRTIRPDYPNGARMRGEEGEATVAFVVGADGTVGDAHIVASTGFAELDAAALKAVRSARFTPARADGEPVAASVQMSLRFKLK